ncbi:acetolactate synthase small subunit [Blattabacterium sp. (Periplaneta americana) str. BPLAN]|uniref:acetolactate synthase n=1 Tax=Blattabacterium sp. (Periplaneta americana) TaxID=367488 RepID=UPI0001BA0B4E|nr:acetolactate synthase [Blattabacterium sp. (Periplaneta americana)]ACX83720.1 acetolactate synthase small subunit [Blattabacterium sp. (Periplaneta americana) str. BPLAN]
MKHQFRIIILVENQIRLLSRILVILNRRNLKINHINVSHNENDPIDMDNVQYILDLECHEEQLIKLTKLIEKLIGIIHVYSFKIKEKNSRENSWKQIDLPLATS